jgi:uncharacterized small protein (DUF1192 family)
MTGKRRIDRITTDEYLEGLSSRPMPDVRALRNECDEEEAVLSFERRLLHARMDILRAELERRAGVGGSILERLPSILADDRQPSRGQIRMKDPVLDFEQPKRRVEKLVSDDTLANLASLSVDEIESTIGVLSDAEREVSETRRKVLAVLDSLNAEIARRYKTGEAKPGDVLTG